MAVQETSPAAPSAQVVGNAFVEQYYHILHESPELVYRFYQDSSILSRTDSSGAMTTVTTTQVINDKILSLNYKDYKAEIETADAQDSHEGGVIVLVTGCLTGKDNVRRKFTQTFFLAPQDRGGYFVLNDVSRFVEDNVSEQNSSASVNNTTGNSLSTTLAVDPEPAYVPDDPVLEPETSLVVDDLYSVDQMPDPMDNGKGSVIEEVVIESPTRSNQIEVLSVVDSSPASLEDTSKKSYASIVKVKKGNRASTAIYVPTSAVRTAPANTEQQSLSSLKSASTLPGAAPPMSDTGPESSNAREEVLGHSIYVKNLPSNATAEQLDEEFKKFGPIKHGGIQVRSSKGFCFGFVEFELLSSMQSALKASPITIGGREAVVEKKRTTARVGSNGRGSYPSGRGRFRSDSFRARGNFGAGRAYGRNEFRNQGDFRNWGEFRNQSEFSGGRRGPDVRNGEGYQWVNQNGNGSGRGGGKVG